MDLERVGWKGRITLRGGLGLVILLKDDRDW